MNNRYARPQGKSQIVELVRKYGPVGAVIASPDKWEQRQADGSWKEIPMPGIVGRSADMFVVDDCD